MKLEKYHPKGEMSLQDGDVVELIGNQLKCRLEMEPTITVKLWQQGSGVNWCVFDNHA